MDLGLAQTEDRFQLFFTLSRADRTNGGRRDDELVAVGGWRLAVARLGAGAKAAQEEGLRGPRRGLRLVT
jgi:hypothetical protein